MLDVWAESSSRSQKAQSFIRVVRACSHIGLDTFGSSLPAAIGNSGSIGEPDAAADW